MSEIQAEQPLQTRDEGVLEEAKNLLLQGKRFMALEDYQSATDHLEQAVQLYDAYYGVGKIQCADAYLEYGLALVALANLESGSGTEKLMQKAGIEDETEDEEEEDEGEGEDEDDGEEEEDDAAEDDVGANDEGKNDLENSSINEGAAKSTDDNLDNGSSKSNGEVPMTSNNLPFQEHAKTNGTHSVQTNGQQDDEPTPGTSSGKVAAADGSGGDDDDEENEASTIEIAWEVLCLAKRLFMTDESLEGRLKLAETYQKLGEISIEWDNNDNAVDILGECLSIRKAILPPEDRLIALTYYNLGLAHSFKSETENANENFQNAMNVIEKRIESLSQDLDKAKQAQDTVVVSSYEKEINELKELLPDIVMRIDDSKEDLERSKEVLKRTRDEIQQEDEQTKKVISDTSKPVDDITHLVKRKAT